MNDRHREFVKLEQDGMPRETALENLLRPTQNVSSSFKRCCKRALDTHWVCARPTKTGLEMNARRMKRRSIDRVLRAYVRSVRKLNKIERIPANDERAKEIKNALMAPLIAKAIAARNEVGQRARSIQLYTAYKLIKAAEKAPDKFNADEINAAKKFLLESLIPPTTTTQQQSETTTTTPNENPNIS